MGFVGGLVRIGSEIGMENPAREVLLQEASLNPQKSKNPSLSFLCDFPSAVLWETVLLCLISRGRNGLVFLAGSALSERRKTGEK
jgi:hypothetical protein